VILIFLVVTEVDILSPVRIMAIDCEMEIGRGKTGCLFLFSGKCIPG